RNQWAREGNARGRPERGFTRAACHSKQRHQRRCQSGRTHRLFSYQLSAFGFQLSVLSYFNASGSELHGSIFEALRLRSGKLEAGSCSFNTQLTPVDQQLTMLLVRGRSVARRESEDTWPAGGLAY